MRTTKEVNLSTRDREDAIVEFIFLVFRKISQLLFVTGSLGMFLSCGLADANGVLVNCTFVGVSMLLCAVGIWFHKWTMLRLYYIGTVDNLDYDVLDSLYD